MPKPWERQWGTPQPAGPSVVFQAPPDPMKAAAERRADEDQAMQRENMERSREKDRRDQLEWTATHKPDGTPKIQSGIGKAYTCLGCDTIRTANRRAGRRLARS
jgi:hypothetical protein